ncbi:MAG TPA: WG repeat-containing protein, partial [Cytophagales bacterium]|nr:WG repeat-containing protein [Cytophagales bacterium]
HYIVANGPKYGLVDSTGKLVIPLEYTDIKFLYDSLILTTKGQELFLLNAEYKRMLQEPLVRIKNISPDYVFYDDTSDYSNPSSIYMLESGFGKYGFLCKTKMIKPEYDNYSFLKSHYLQLGKGGKLLITDLNLQPVNTKLFDEIQDLGAYYIYKQQGFFGLLKSNFTPLLPAVHKEITAKSFHDKMYIVYKKEAKNAVTIYDLETQEEILRLPFADVAELENGDLVESYRAFPKYVQVFNATGKTGVYDLQKKQLVVSITHNSLSYINKDRFISYDNYSKFQVIYRNRVLSKDTILGYVLPFDTLPVTAFYKDIIHNNKRVRFYGAFNLDGEVLVPYPVAEMQIMSNKITFSTKNGTKSVVKYDKYGRFDELIENYTSIIIYDTTEKERPKKYYNPCLNNKLDYTSKYQFLYTSVDQTVNNQRIALGVKRIYARERKDCAFGGALVVDAHLGNLEELGIAPVLTRDFSFKVADVKRNRFFETLVVDVGGKPQKKKFSFVTAYYEGLAAVDFTAPEENLISRHEKLRRYFGEFYSRRYFYSESHLPNDFLYHTGNWGFIDTTGKVTITPRFTKVSSFYKGVAIVQEGTKYALVNHKGENVANRFFYAISRVATDTLFVVEEQFNGMGYIDKKFKTMLTAAVRGRTDAVGNDIYPIYCKNKKWAFRHFNGQWITDSTYAAVKPFVEGYAPVQDQLWTFIDTTGKPITAFIYAEVKPMQCNRAFVKLPNKEEYLLIDNKGTRVGKNAFDNVFPYELDLAIVQKDGLWGVVDKMGEWVYKNEFTSITPFNIHGEAKAVKEGVIYIISSEKKITKFDKKEMSYEKDARKLDDAEVAYYNELINNKLKGIRLHADKRLFYKNSIKETRYLPFVQPTKCGLMSSNGNLILEVDYQHISAYKGDTYKVYKQNDIGYFSLTKGWIYKPW